MVNNYLPLLERLSRTQQHHPLADRRAVLCKTTNLLDKKARRRGKSRFVPFLYRQLLPECSISVERNQPHAAIYPPNLRLYDVQQFCQRSARKRLLYMKPVGLLMVFRKFNWGALSCHSSRESSSTPSSKIIKIIFNRRLKIRFKLYGGSPSFNGFYQQSLSLPRHRTLPFQIQAAH